CLSSLNTPSSLVKPRFEASARPRFSNSSVTSRRCSRTFIHAWNTTNDTTIGTRDQKTRARKLEKPRNPGQTVTRRLLDDVRGARQDPLRDFQAELLRRLEVDGQREFAGVRGRDLGCRAPRKDGLGKIARLPADIFTARE